MVLDPTSCGSKQMRIEKDTKPIIVTFFLLGLASQIQGLSNQHETNRKAALGYSPSTGVAWAGAIFGNQKHPHSSSNFEVIVEGKLCYWDML